MAPLDVRTCLGRQRTKKKKTHFIIENKYRVLIIFILKILGTIV